MTQGFTGILAASPGDRRDLFLTTATRLGTPIQNVEKDFWVTWTLALLFGGSQSGEPRLLFKGGTSLSKAHGLISRFSEDIDITVFRQDIGQNIETADLEKLTGKQQRLRLAQIRQACQGFIQGALRERLNRQITTAFLEARLSVSEPPVFADPDDPDRQTLLIRYPSVVVADDDYVRPTVKIEAGAKSALDPHRALTLRPYVADDLGTFDLAVRNVATIDAERTFWDKIVILHGLRCWFDHRGTLRHQGHRVSRHYYDLHMLSHAPAGQQATRNQPLALDCARHARLFFNSANLDLAHAIPGSFKIVPSPAMVDALKSDYRAMRGMIFGEVPEFADILDSVRQQEDTINDLSKYHP